MSDYDSVNPLRITAILGSARLHSMTAKVLAVVLDELRSMPGIEVDVIDPREIDLRIPGLGESPDALDIQERIGGSDGVILASPEYHGSFSSTMKLLIDNLGFPSRLKGKPVALLGVAAGRIGAIKALEHLRSVASHVGSLVLPGPVSVASVHGVLNSDGQIIDQGLEKVVRNLAVELVEYVRRHSCPKSTLEYFVREPMAL